MGCLHSGEFSFVCFIKLHLFVCLFIVSVCVGNGAASELCGVHAGNQQGAGLATEHPNIFFLKPECT